MATLDADDLAAIEALIPTAQQNSNQVWQDLYIEEIYLTASTSTTVSLDSQPNAAIQKGSIIQLFDDNSVLVHIAVATNITQNSATFDPPYTGNAFIELVHFYRLGSLVAAEPVATKQPRIV